MFCSNCGHKLTEGQKFCPSCGESTGLMNNTVVENKAETPEPAVEQIPAAPVAPADNSIYKPASQSAVNGTPYYQPSFEEPKSQPKKKKKGLKALIIILVALALFAALVVGLVFLFKGFVKTPVQEMQEMERMSFKQGISGLEDASETIKKADRKIAYKFNADVGEALKSLISTSYLDFDWLNSVSLIYTFDSSAADNGVQEMFIRALLNGTEITTGTLKTDMESGSILFYSPELAAGKILAIESQIREFITQDEAQELLDRVTDLLKKYHELVISHIKEAKREESVKFAAAGVESTCTALTAELTGKEFLEIILDVLNTLKTDQEVREIITKYVKPDAIQAVIGILGSYGANIDIPESAEEIYQSITDKIDKAIEDLNNSIEDLDGTEGIAITDYIVGGEIKGRKLIVSKKGEEHEIYCALARNNGQFGAELTVEGQTILQAVGTYSGDVYSGTANLIINGDEVATVEFSNFDWDNKTVKATLSLSETYWKILASGSYTPLMKTVRLTLDIQKDHYTLDVTMSGASMLKMTLEKVDPESVPAIPSGDRISSDEYLDSINLTTIKKNLSDAGVPQILITMIDMIIGQIPSITQ